MNFDESLVGELTLGMGILLFVCVALIIWDVFLYAKKQKTISHYVTKSSYYSPMIPFVIGLLIGHWFW